jgi:hypothetical protein
MAALSTNYGAPAQTRTTPSGTKKSTYKEGYNLSSLSKSSRSGRLDKSKISVSKLSAPVRSWDRGNHHASVVSGDQHSMESHESKQMIISKNTEWQVDFEGLSQRSAEP